MTEPILVADGVRKEFFRKGRQSARMFEAVAPVDLCLESGGLVIVRGRSGSGKTTLLNMLGGLLAPTDGTVSFKGQDIYALGDEQLSRLRNEQFGIIPQGQTALYSLTVIQNVMIARSLYESEGIDEDCAYDLLSVLGIDDLADSMPAELSGGELRRMAIARALMGDPEVILADEPTGDLDDENTQLVMELLRERADGGATVLVVTHEQTVEGYADSILQMGTKQAR